MFFLTLLLEEVLSWTRKQSGTSNPRSCTSTRFGYLPPYPANPPPEAAIDDVDRACAFGVGLLLATQNPADLD